MDARFAPFLTATDPEPQLVRRSSNEVFRASRAGAPVYLRVTPPGHRAQGEVEAELAWMAAAAADGLRVVRPIASAEGRLVERVGSSGACVVCLQAAPGRPARKPDDYQPAVVDSWAALLSDLHRHARTYRPPGVARRQAWDQDQVFRTATRARDPGVGPAIEVMRALVSWMRGLDTGREVYGLTHADLHLGNLAVGDGDQVTAFDFDDACVHWFAHDLAVAVLSIRKAAREFPGRFDGAGVERAFLDAYARRSGLAEVWYRRLEAFVAYRIALSACWASAALDAGELDDELTAWFHRSLPLWLDELRVRQREMQRAMAV